MPQVRLPWHLRLVTGSVADELGRQPLPTYTMRPSPTGLIQYRQAKNLRKGQGTPEIIRKAVPLFGPMAYEGASLRGCRKGMRRHSFVTSTFAMHHRGGAGKGENACRSFRSTWRPTFVRGNRNRE
jgi:hypothetical protein